MVAIYYHIHNFKLAQPLYFIWTGDWHHPLLVKEKGITQRASVDEPH